MDNLSGPARRLKMRIDMAGIHTLGRVNINALNGRASLTWARQEPFYPLFSTVLHGKGGRGTLWNLRALTSLSFLRFPVRERHIALLKKKTVFSSRARVACEFSTGTPSTRGNCLHAIGVPGASVFESCRDGREG